MSASKQLVPVPGAIPSDMECYEESAQWTYERLVTFINNFESALDDEHEVGVRLVSFGAEVTFHIEDIGYWEPDIITFYGVGDDGESIQLIQHLSQLSVLLVAMKKLEDDPRRIGFDLESRAAERKAAKMEKQQTERKTQG